MIEMSTREALYWYVFWAWILICAFIGLKGSRALRRLTERILERK